MTASLRPSDTSVQPPVWLPSPKSDKARRVLPPLALTANSFCLIAIGNDSWFEQVFSRQIKAIGNEGDVAVEISTSRNSLNVVWALQIARGRDIGSQLR